MKKFKVGDKAIIIGMPEEGRILNLCSGNFSKIMINITSRSSYNKG